MCTNWAACELRTRGAVRTSARLAQAVTACGRCACFILNRLLRLRLSEVLWVALSGHTGGVNSAQPA